MKKYILYTLLAAVAITTSCKDDFLDTTPEASLDAATVFSDPKVAEYAINGIAELFYKKYDTQNKFGEGSVYMFQGEWVGDAMQKSDHTSFSNIMRCNYTNSAVNANTNFAWSFYYRIIKNANEIIGNCPTEYKNGTEEKAYKGVLARALCYRAYGYTMMSQIYCHRWSDEQGKCRGLVLRLDPEETGDLGASSLEDTYKQIYADLDLALQYFQESGYKRSMEPDMRWMIDENVAHAIYSRAALIRNDWQKAVEESQKARKGFSIMGPEQYAKGFNAANDEWIWECYEDETQSISLYSYFVYMSGSCNSTYSYKYPPTISKELVDKIDPNDARLDLYGIPTKDELADLKKTDAATYKKIMETGSTCGKVTKGKFFKRMVAEFRETGRFYSSTYIYLYCGAKFVLAGGKADGCIPIFRAAEMIYNEAEGQLRLGNEAAARKLLEEATRPYNEEYSCTATGQALWDELKTLRKFDLWSEGQNWFDLKRWGDPLVRHTWKEGGNWLPQFVERRDAADPETAGVYGPEQKNHWTYVYPKIETNYNAFVDVTEPDDWYARHQK